VPPSQPALPDPRIRLLRRQPETSIEREIRWGEQQGENDEFKRERAWRYLAEVIEGTKYL
jgi:hypothetical protein